MKKILAIDDQKDNLVVIKAVIKNHIPGCEVLTALSGREGIKIARKEQPDTILLDIIMPGMDGYETCKRLKADELTKHIPILMLTAVKTDIKSKIKGLDTGADAFFTKPIDAVELTAQLNVMLRIKEAEDKLQAEKELLDEKVIKKTKELKESEEYFRTLIENSSDV
ncbi:MAG: response regulator, partial [Chlorobi bacterium]|nr:response regulator [Chlorobiota bacterium]